jgi:hypothetical protein
LGIFGVHATGVIAIEQQSHQQFWFLVTAEKKNALAGKPEE